MLESEYNLCEGTPWNQGLVVQTPKQGFELAKKASEFSDYNKKNIHIGSVIMYKNRILGIGYNKNKTR